MKNKLMLLVATLAITTSAATAAPKTSGVESTSDKQVVKQVRHELVTLPYYGVFDNLGYKVEGTTVTLFGQVTRPTTRHDAGRRVAKIAGVQQVVNNIKVLPLSSFDDSIRARTYRAVFRSGSLYRYAMGANPSIHIIVDRGHVTLEGVVGSKMDRQLAYIAANGVFGTFSVTNNLRTENDSEAY
ncbi:MAG: BON domain-containing protein [Acidobacteriota bacterium]